MHPFHRFTLQFKDKKLAEIYTMTFTKKIFRTLMIITLIRIVRLVFSILYVDPHSNYIYLIPDFSVMLWVTLALQIVLVILQKIFPAWLNRVAVPLWMILGTVSLIPTQGFSYSMYAFIWK